MNYQVNGSVALSAPIPNTDQQQVQLNFSGVNVVINVAQSDVGDGITTHNWLPGSPCSVVFSATADS